MVLVGSFFRSGGGAATLLLMCGLSTIVAGSDVTSEESTSTKTIEQEEPRVTGHLYPKKKEERARRRLEGLEMNSAEYWAALEEEDEYSAITAQFTQFEQTVDDMTLICEGEVTLMDLDCPEDACDRDVVSDDAVAGCERCRAIFCQMDFELEKTHPERYPSMTDLVGASRHCDSAPISMDLGEVVRGCRAYDAARTTVLPVVVPLRGLIFESGGTDAALATSALSRSSPAYRVLSEPRAVTEAATVCDDYRKRRRRAYKRHVADDDDDRCDRNRAAVLLREVVALLSRSRDVREEHMVVRADAAFAAAGGIDTYERAFPDRRWIFVYDEPAAAVGAQMGRFKPERAFCVADRRDPPASVRDVVRRVDPSINAGALGAEDYCAARLAASAEDALRAAAKSGRGTMIPSDDVLSTLSDVLESFGASPSATIISSNSVTSLEERNKALAKDFLLSGLVDESGTLDLALQQKLKQKKLDKTTPALEQASLRFYAPVFSEIQTAAANSGLKKEKHEYLGEIP